MNTRTRLGRNPFDRPAKVKIPPALSPAAKRPVLKTAVRKAPPATQVHEAAPKAGQDPWIPETVFHLAFEIPAHGFFAACKAFFVAAAVVRELRQFTQSV